jgi:hypothetical protein
VGVTVMMVDIAVVPLFTATKEGTFPPPLLTKPTAGLLLVQSYVAPIGSLVKLLAGTKLPAHTVSELGTKTVGNGFTLTLNTSGEPPQTPEVGVIVYTATPSVVPVATNVCDIFVPLPLLAPDTPLWLTVQVKLVPDTLLISGIFVVLPEHMD